MSNRVEDLEAKVAELQAAVDGLTEELVETKERLRELEASPATDDAAANGDAPAPESGSDGDAINNGDGESGDNGGSEESDIIVA